MIHKWCGVILLIFSGMLLCGTPSPADDSAMFSVAGGVVTPMAAHPSIRMVNETVNIRLSDKAARVRCKFVFKNEGKRSTVKMGFPEQADASGDGGLGILLGFRSWVDGKPVKCVYKQGKAMRPRPTESEGSRRSWYVKDVPFEAGQTRTVVDEYNADLGSASDSMQTEYETPRDFSYVLLTGRNWKGPIGKATIIVDVSRVDEDHYEFDLGPTGSVRAKKTISWTFTNFEPTKDIYISLVPRFPKLNDKIVDPEQWRPFMRDHGVTMTGMGFLAKLGARVEYPEKNRVFLIEHGGHTMRLTPGSKTAILDGKSITLQAALPKDGPYPGQIPTADVVRALGGKAYYSSKEGRLLLWLKSTKAK